MALKRPRLGRGLSSLMATSVAVEAPPGVEGGVPGVDQPLALSSSQAGDQAIGGVRWLPLGDLSPNPYQPRLSFDEPALAELAASIGRDGVMQPIVVRPGAGGSGYEIVAGERRWRAGQLAGLSTIPAIVRDLDDRQLAEWALIENLQREDLDPLEQAQAFARLTEQFGLTHEQVAERVGIDRSTVSNALRLLHLGEEVQQFVRRGQLTAGHVRALLAVEDPNVQLQIARNAIKGGWPVRKLEQEVRHLTAPGRTSTRRQTSARSAHLTDLARQIAQQLNTRVEIRPGRDKSSGRLIIDYFGLDEFDDLMRRMNVTIE
jgi:ParB family transcriptional regulator, chromosome partitioning protein